MVAKETIGQRLRRLRLQKGLSLREVQERAGVSNAYLSQIETDRRPAPSPRFLRRLAELYEIPVEELMYAAGYLDRPRPLASDVDRAYRYAVSDPEYRFGTRLADDVDPEDLPFDVKVYIIRMYEKQTGKTLLPGEPHQ